MKSFKKLIFNVSKSFSIGKHLAQIKNTPAFIYPETEVDDTVIDDYFGTQVYKIYILGFLKHHKAAFTKNLFSE